MAKNVIINGVTYSNVHVVNVPLADGSGTAKFVDDTEIKQELDQLKDDLSNKLPKSPADWEAWTAEEQAAARERMGIPGGYELLVSQELTETVVNISFDLGKTANEIYMLCESPKVTGVSPCNWKDENGKSIGYWPSSVLSTNVSRYVMTHFYTIDNVRFVCDTRYGTNNLAVGTKNASYHDLNNGVSKLAGTYANGLVAGTKFTIWGR